MTILSLDSCLNKINNYLIYLILGSSFRQTGLRNRNVHKEHKGAEKAV